MNADLSPEATHLIEAEVERPEQPQEHHAEFTIASEEIPAGVEVALYWPHPEDVHVFRQIGIRPQEPGAVGAARRSVKMDNLFQSMDARVGAAGATEPNLVISNGGEGLLQGLLHRAHPNLTLPAVKRAPVVLDAHGEARRLCFPHLGAH